MLEQHRPARVNVKVLIVVLVVMVALAGSLIAARQVRRSILSKRDLAAGQAAYEARDWPTAYKHFQEFLGRNPDNIEILKKFALARLSMQPFEPEAIPRAAAAYRRVIQLDPLDEIAYDELVRLYEAVGNFDELAYIARKRMAHCPDDKKAPLWLADALISQDKKPAAQDVLETYIADVEALPDKHNAYVRAYLLMSRIMDSDAAMEARLKALEWLRSAIDYAPKSVEVLVQRAQFYLTKPELPGLSEAQRQDAARQDLETADALGTDNPHLRLSVGAMWMVLGEVDRAQAELQAMATLDQESLAKHYLDAKDWLISRYLFAAELALRRGVPTEAASLADETLSKLARPGHRMRVLPAAINAYIAAGRVPDARQCMDEYTKAVQAHAGTRALRTTLAYAQAQVAQAEDSPYAVIEILEPVLAEDATRPELWRVLARAYGHTGQTQEAINTLSNYLALYPQDGAMVMQLAQEYFKLGNWRQAYDVLKPIEALTPPDMRVKLLRIEAEAHLAGQRQDKDKVKLQTLTEELAELRRHQPERADIRMLQAVIARYLAQPDQAERELKLILAECEESLGARLQLARHYLDTQRPDAAIEICRDACKRHAELPEAWLRLTRMHEAVEDHDAARACLRHGLEKVVGRWEKRSLSMRLAILELMHGERTAGIDLLREWAAQDERDIYVRSLLLGVREMREDQATRKRLIQELRQAEGENGLRWRFHQASLWMAASDWRARQQAIADSLQFCLEQDPQWSSPAVLLLDMYDRLRDSKRFEDTCRRVLLRNPGATRVADQFINFLEKQRRFAEAEEVLRQMETDSPLASAWEARLALRAGDVSRAIDELKVRISSDDRDINARIFLARVLYQEMGDVAQAFAYLKEAEAISPDARRLIAAKVSILSAEKRSQDAQRLLDDYVARENTFAAYRLRAAYLSHEGQLDQAEQDYRKLTSFAEQGAIGIMLLSSFYLRHEKCDAAVETLEQGLVSYPANLGLKRMLMQTLTLRGAGQDQEKALDILTALEEQLPHDPDLMKRRVAELLGEPTPQSIQRAQEKLTQIVTLESTAVKAHLTLIDIAMRKQEYETARDHAMRALGANPDNPDLMSAHSAVELALGNTALASEIAHLVLQKNPHQGQALGVLLTIALRSQNAKRLEEVRELISAAVNDNPAHEKLQLMHVEVLVALELVQHAIERLEAYCQTEAGHSSATALVAIAGLYRQNGDMERARQKLDQAEQVAPNLPGLIDERINWATSLYQAGKADQARRRFDELRAQYPTNIPVLNNLAWLLQDHYQQYEEALELANQGLSLSPDDLHLLDTRGTILLKLPDRMADARKDFSRLVELSPADSPRRAKSLLQLGRICAKYNDLAQAKQHLMSALAIDRSIDVFTPEERSEIARTMDSRR